MKKVWRERGKEILRSLPMEEKDRISKGISNHILRTSWWQDANTIGITMSTPLELNTKYLIEQAWKEGKTVAVPKCYPTEDHKMIFYEMKEYDQLEMVYAKIREPKPEVSQQVSKRNIDLLFVPGLLFDVNGYRIGFGGGYYDRYLVDYTNETIAIAVSNQIVPDIPHEEFDLPVHHIITEKGVLF